MMSDDTTERILYLKIETLTSPETGGQKGSWYNSSGQFIYTNYIGNYR